MIIYSWNVNSLRNCENSFLSFVNTYSPDIIFIQELRAHPDQLSFFLKTIDGYSYLFNDSGRLGYGGTAIYYKTALKPEIVSKSVGNSVLDSEGRVIYMKLDDYHLFNFYTPNGNMSEERLEYKLNYYDEMLKLAKSLKKDGKKVIIGGDLNVAYTELDQYIKKGNVSGCLPIEREWFKDLSEEGYIDTFREFNKEKGFYTWWSLRDSKREENKGWRYDYFLLSNNLKGNLINAGILKDIFGSDHCPIWIEIK